MEDDPILAMDTVNGHENTIHVPYFYGNIEPNHIIELNYSVWA
jgi:hypothetical protein